MLLEEERSKLIERLGVSIEKDENLAPLAARILSTLILLGNKGCSFDELVHRLNASKSTISSHLSHLETNGRISYYTKQGDRKRYFVLSKDHTINMINKVILKWENQKVIHQEVFEFKQSFNKVHEGSADDQLDPHFHEDYLVFIEEASSAFQKLKQTIINKQKTE